MSSTSTDLDDLRQLKIFKTPETEIRAEDKNFEYDEKVGKISGQILLYTECKYLSNFSATS
jgi:hypothetical protein